MTVNDTAIRPAKCQVILGNGSTSQCSHYTSQQASHSVHRAQAHVFNTIWPGDYIEVDVSESTASVTFLALAPRSDSHCSEVLFSAYLATGKYHHSNWW